MYDEIAVDHVFGSLAAFMETYGGTLTLCLRHATRGSLLAPTAQIALFRGEPEIGPDGDIPKDDPLHLFGGDRAWRVPEDAEAWQAGVRAHFESRAGVRVTELRTYGPVDDGPNNMLRGWDFRIHKSGTT